MSGGSFNYLCDREPGELQDRTDELTDMARYLRGRGNEREARETERIIERITAFYEEIRARTQDLHYVWKAAEWYRSGDWDAASITSAVEQHNYSHPADTWVPGLSIDVGEIPWHGPRTNLAPNPSGLPPVQTKFPAQGGDKLILRYPRNTPAEGPPKPSTLDDEDDFRWADDQTQWAQNFAREELEWIQWAAGDAIRIQDEQAEERARQSAETARWDKRRAELIEQFNGGPLNVANGQPIPTMALQAVEYIIETERNAEKGQA